MIIVILYFGSRIEIENKNRKDNLDYKTINIHNIYDILKRKEKVKDNSFIKNQTIKELTAGPNFYARVRRIIKRKTKNREVS